MGYLKRMVREQSHVVIASIHQPRSAIWMVRHRAGSGRCLERFASWQRTAAVAADGHGSLSQRLDPGALLGVL